MKRFLCAVSFILILSMTFFCGHVDTFDPQNPVIEIASENDTLTGYVNHNYDIMVSVLYPEELDEVSYKTGNGISGNFSSSELSESLFINLSFSEPCTTYLVISGLESDLEVTSDTAILIVSDPLTVKLYPSRFYASPSLQCTVKVSTGNHFPGQQITSTPQINKDSLFFFKPSKSEIGNKVNVSFTAFDNREPSIIARDSVLITVIADKELPPPPDNLKISEKTSKYVKISWDRVSIADSYVLFRKKPDSADSAWEDMALPDTFYIDSTKNIYMYRVASVNYFGQGEKSEIIYGVDNIHYAHRLFFTDSSSVAHESSGLHVIKVQVTKPAIKTITVRCTLTGDSEISADFESSVLLAMIAPGDTMGLCTLKIIDDNSAEQIKSFSVYLDSVSHGFISGLREHIIQLVDDDSLYSVTYDANGADSGEVPVDSRGYGKNSVVSVKGNTGNLSKAGYSFTGWRKSSSDMKSILYGKGDTLIIGAANIKLYAQWQINKYSVIYDGNGNTDGNVPDAEEHEYKKVIVVADKPSGLKKAGFTFIGWNTKADGTGDTLLPGDSLEMGPSDITLYALWEINKYEVKYNGNGNDSGSAPSAKEYEYNADVAIANKPSGLKKTGFTFIGWNTKADGTGDTLLPGDTIKMGLSDITLYALWEINEYKVKPDSVSKKSNINKKNSCKDLVNIINYG